MLVTVLPIVIMKWSQAHIIYMAITHHSAFHIYQEGTQHKKNYPFVLLPIYGIHNATVKHFSKEKSWKGNYVVNGTDKYPYQKDTLRLKHSWIL